MNFEKGPTQGGKTVVCVKNQTQNGVFREWNKRRDTGSYRIGVVRRSLFGPGSLVVTLSGDSGEPTYQVWCRRRV